MLKIISVLIKFNMNNKVIYFKRLSDCKIYKTISICTENSKSSRCIKCEAKNEVRVKRLKINVISKLQKTIIKM